MPGESQPGPVDGEGVSRGFNPPGRAERHRIHLRPGKQRLADKGIPAD
jgi:hypothetical protein